MIRRKRRRNAYVGCSLTSNYGTLRLEWRIPDLSGRRRWQTRTLADRRR